jgi:2-polyprenyl-3-methyl-5-hydroxy-6-metoxy-1,4-benzoquinol methylase
MQQSQMIYKNHGNQLVLSMLRPDARRVLDIGCGAGDNARILLNMHPSMKIVGITLSPAEAAIARAYLEEVHIADVEESDLSFISGSFDAVICSHVLEHLKHPVAVLKRVIQFLNDEGQVVVAVPNVVELKNRIKLVLGKFEYENQGIMDSTHLRFFTWHSAAKNLIEPIPELHLESKVAEGSFPLWWFRRFLLPRFVSHWFDALATRAFPNLFGWQIVICARRCQRCGPLE